MKIYMTEDVWCRPTNDMEYREEHYYWPDPMISFCEGWRS